MRRIEKVRKYVASLGLILFLALSVLWFGTTDARAQSTQFCDNAELFSEVEVFTLTEAAHELEEQTGWDVIVVTVDDSSVSSTQYYAEEQFNELGTGDDGIVYLLDMYNREMYVATAGEAYQYITDSREDEMLDKALRYAQKSDYADAIQSMIDDTKTFYDEGLDNDLTIYDEDNGTYTRYHNTPARTISFMEVIVAAVAGIIACVVFCVAINGKYRLKFGRYRYDFRSKSQVNLTRKEDRLVNQFVTHRRIPKNPPPSGGGGRGGGMSTIHTGAGGRSFGGGGRKF
jgi:uncharacterized protein